MVLCFGFRAEQSEVQVHPGGVCEMNCLTSPHTLSTCPVLSTDSQPGVRYQQNSGFWGCLILSGCPELWVTFGCSHCPRGCDLMQHTKPLNSLWTLSFREKCQKNKSSGRQQNFLPNVTLNSGPYLLKQVWEDPEVTKKLFKVAFYQNNTPTQLRSQIMLRRL
jgi:hypothetical protein